jgi:hypothetical protein
VSWRLRKGENAGPRRRFRLYDDGTVIFFGGLVKEKNDGYVILIRKTVIENGQAMVVKETEHELVNRTRRFVKAELKRADVTYEELAQRLAEMGWPETKGSIAAKLSRGGFTASFFVAVMKAIGRESVNLADV